MSKEDGKDGEASLNTTHSAGSDVRHPPFPAGIVDEGARSPPPVHKTAEALLNAAAKHVFPESERTEIPSPRNRSSSSPEPDVTKEGRPAGEAEPKEEEREEEPIIGGTPLDEMTPMESPMVGKSGGGASGGFPFGRQPSWKAAGQQMESGRGGGGDVSRGRSHQLMNTVIPEHQQAMDHEGRREEEVSVKAVRPGFGAGRELGSVRMGASALMSALNALPWEEDDGGSSSDGSSSDDEGHSTRPTTGQPQRGVSMARPKMSRMGSSLHTIRPDDRPDLSLDTATQHGTASPSPATPRRMNQSLHFPFRQNTIARKAQSPSVNELDYQLTFRHANEAEAAGIKSQVPGETGKLPVVAELIADESRRSSFGSSSGSSASMPPEARTALDEQISREEDQAGVEEQVEMAEAAEEQGEIPDLSLEEAPSDQNADAALREGRQEEDMDMEEIEEKEIVVGERQRMRREKLGQKLMEVFGLQEREEVLQEMRCWLLRSVMLKGYMYLTQKHICFFAHMPNRETVVVKSGPLSKKASRTKLTTKFWVVLKNDVLSWFESTADPYFPKGNISLEYVSSCDAIDELRFKLRTPERNYTFSAETESARDEWVKVIQKVMFKTQHEGENVKLVIPLSAILEIEKSPTLEFAETIEIRCVDPDDQMSVDSYFFASFSDTERAMRSIQRLIDARPEMPMLRRLSDYSDISDGDELRRRKSSSSKTVAGVASAGLKKVGSVLRPLVSRGTDKDKDKNDSSSTLVDDDKERKSTSTSILGVKLPLRRRESDETLHAEDISQDEAYEGYPPRQVGQAPSTSSSGEKGWSSWIKKPVSKVLHPSSSSSNNSLHRATSSQSSLAKPSRSPRASTKPLHKSPYLAPADSGLSPATSRREQLVPGEPERVTEVVEPIMDHPDTDGDGDSADDEGENQRGSALAGARRWKSRQSFASDNSASSGLGRSEYAVVEDDEDGQQEEAETARKFRSVFSLSEKEELIDHFPGFLYRVLPVSGRFFVSTNYFCFRSSQLLYKTKMIIPIRDLYGLKAQKAFRFSHSGLIIVIKGHEEIFLEFSTAERREACVRILEERMEAVRLASSPGGLSGADSETLNHDKIEMRIMEDLDESAPIETRSPPPVSPSPMFGSTTSTFLEFKPEPMRVTCLTIGSRGDVQPYIALCKGLQAEGHTTRIATHGEYKDWVEGHGIEFASVGGDPAELMQMCVDNGMFTISFMKEGLQKFRGWLDDLLMSSWEACQGSDLLIESPSAMGGVHIAEALQIPYFRAFTMPWTRTRAYPHAFAVPEHKKGGAFNYMTYTMFDQVFWRAISGQINRWRRKVMHIEPTTFDKLEQHKIPFLYNFSPSVVPPPLDWTEWIHVTGYWFLENADESAAKKKKWTPPEGLLEFMETAKSKGKKIVYIGFGSIVVSDPEEMTRCVVDAVVDADVYAILSKGWSDRGSKAKDEEEDTKDGADGVKYPPEIFSIDSIDHSWLFPRIDAACHHGGAGTTGASLRAGIPTIIKPFFGDQAFWSERVESLNVGSAVRKLTSEALAEALKKATTDEKQIAKAKVVGEIIRKENGVVRAIEAIYRDLEYAKSQIKPPPSTSDHSIPLGKVSSILSIHSRDLPSLSGLTLARTNSPKKDQHRDKPRSGSGSGSGSWKTARGDIHSALASPPAKRGESRGSTGPTEAHLYQQKIEEEILGHDAKSESVSNANSRDVSTDRAEGEREQGSDGSWSVVSGEGRSRAASTTEVPMQMEGSESGSKGVPLAPPISLGPAV